MERLRESLTKALGRRCDDAAAQAGTLTLRLGDATIAIACARRIEGGGAAELAGRRLDRLELSPAGDLALGFEGLVVRAFCQGRASTALRHWGLTHAGTTWEARPDGARARVDTEGERMLDGHEELRQALALLERRPCWCVVPAGPHGAVQLALGLRLEREFELQIDAFPETFRTHAPELGLHVECAWRLEDAGGVVCSARDALVLDGRFPRGLAHMVDRSVEAARLVGSAGDLEVRFDGGLVLRVFADRVAADRGEDNWTLAIPGEMLTVGPGGRVRRELVTDRPALRVVR